MWYFARLSARDRAYTAALTGRPPKPGSLEADRLWRETPVQVEPNDTAAVPNWIAWVDMAATVAALGFLGWAAVAYWASGKMTAADGLTKAVILVGVGPILFCGVGNWIDNLIFRLAMGRPESLMALLTRGPSLGRALVLNFVRPVVTTVIVFGGGLLGLALLRVQGWPAIAAGLWYFFLTQLACLSGRRQSLFEAGWAMVITIVLLIGAFVGLARH